MTETGFSRDISLLETEVCWVIFRFPDKSLKMIRTTLRPDMMADMDSPENCLYDLDYRRWLDLGRMKGAQLEIYLEAPELEGVDLFANKFIT